jgi:threonine/homoserine/homoserine lactone efflux protein
MAAELAKSFLFGVTVAAAFGPIALLIVSHGMRDGFKPAAAAGLGAALADLAYAGVAFSLGAVALAALARYESALKLAAALALLGFGAWHAGRPSASRRPKRRASMRRYARLSRLRS